MRGYKSDVSFVCPECRTPVSETIDVPEPYWAADRASDMTAEDDTDITCQRCNTEFPAHVHNAGGHCDISLEEYPEVKIQAGHAYYDGPDDDEPWVDYSIPDYPYGIFIDSYHETGDLLADRGGDGRSLVNRMLFVQQVGALEAYLGDTLINEALSNNNAIVRLLENDADLKNKKYSLAQIVGEPDLVKTEVKVYLKSVIYHNIAKVRALYKIVFEFDLYTLLSEHKDALFEAIEYRHHCVHRNGRDKDGNQLDIFTKEYVQQQADKMKAFAVKIQNEIMPKATFNGDMPF
jgi:hypothetical protein